MNNKIYVTNTTNPNLKRIEELEHDYFMLEMQDHWDSSDYKLADKIMDEIRKLKGE